MIITRFANLLCPVSTVSITPEESIISFALNSSGVLSLLRYFS